MARGNDAQAALHELADRFGQGVGNAEELIDANLAAHSAALRAAEILPRDEAATREAQRNMSSLKGPDGEEVVAVAVRRSEASDNAHTVIVYRSAEGRDLLAVLDGKGNVLPQDPRPGDAHKPKAATSSGTKD